MNERACNLIEVLEELRSRYPHWRFGQLVSNVAGWADVDLWDVDDEQLLVAATAHIEQLKSRDQVAPETSASPP